MLLAKIKAKLNDSLPNNSEAVLTLSVDSLTSDKAPLKVLPLPTNLAKLELINLPALDALIPLSFKTPNIAPVSPIVKFKAFAVGAKKPKLSDIPVKSKLVDVLILDITSANSWPLSAPLPNAFKTLPNNSADSSAVAFKPIPKLVIGSSNNSTSSFVLPKENKVVANFATSFEVLTLLPATFKIACSTDSNSVRAKPLIPAILNISASKSLTLLKASLTAPVKA